MPKHLVYTLFCAMEFTFYCNFIHCTSAGEVNNEKNPTTHQSIPHTICNALTLLIEQHYVSDLLLLLLLLLLLGHWKHTVLCYCFALPRTIFPLSSRKVTVSHHLNKYLCGYACERFQFFFYNLHDRITYHCYMNLNVRL